MKKCFTCKEQKSFELFSKDKNSKDNHKNQCKTCAKLYRDKNKEYFKNYRIVNKDNKSELNKKYYILNKEFINERNKVWRENNKDKIKEYKKSDKKYNKKYNAEYHKEYIKEYFNKRLKEDSNFKFKHNVRNLISQSFKRNNNFFNKNSKSEEILGCTLNEFRSYIESKFTEGMNFENYGKWHLDHIIPLASVITEEDIIKLNHYTNFQPLWAFDNLSKGSKIL